MTDENYRYLNDSEIPSAVEGDEYKHKCAHVWSECLYGNLSSPAGAYPSYDFRRPIKPSNLSEASPLPYTPDEILEIAVSGMGGGLFDSARILATYADERNWTKIYDADGAHWCWIGPVTVGFELAQWAGGTSK